MAIIDSIRGVFGQSLTRKRPTTVLLPSGGESLDYDTTTDITFTETLSKRDLTLEAKKEGVLKSFPAYLNTDQSVDVQENDLIVTATGEKFIVKEVSLKHDNILINGNEELQHNHCELELYE